MFLDTLFLIADDENSTFVWNDQVKRALEIGPNIIISSYIYHTVDK